MGFELSDCHYHLKGINRETGELVFIAKFASKKTAHKHRQELAERFPADRYFVQFTMQGLSKAERRQCQQTERLLRDVERQCENL
jgi:hypothetical protein